MQAEALHKRNKLYIHRDLKLFVLEEPPSLRELGWLYFKFEREISFIFFFQNNEYYLISNFIKMLYLDVETFLLKL